MRSIGLPAVVFLPYFHSVSRLQYNREIMLHCFHNIPHFSGGRKLAVLGERGKWVPVSTQRTKSVEVTPNSIVVHVEGVPGEVRNQNNITR